MSVFLWLVGISGYLFHFSLLPVTKQGPGEGVWHCWGHTGIASRSGTWFQVFRLLWLNSITSWGWGGGSPSNSNDWTPWKLCFLSPQWQGFGGPGLGPGLLTLSMCSPFCYWPLLIFTATLWGREFCSHFKGGPAIAQALQRVQCHLLWG